MALLDHIPHDIAARWLLQTDRYWKAADLHFLRRAVNTPALSPTETQKLAALGRAFSDKR